MTKLGIALLAASAAFLPNQATAQTVPDPDPASALPNLALQLPASASVSAPAASVRVDPAPRAGTTWGEATLAAQGSPMGGAMGHPPMTGRPPMAGHPPHMGRPPMTGRPPMMGRPPRMGHPPMMGRPPHMGHPPMMGHPPRMGHPPMNGGHRFFRWQRINRGGFVPRNWWGPRFTISNWGLYGFPQPYPGGRWIRYYDDALMIDRDGRVLDGRYGWDWDRYGDRWSYGEDGVPMYGDDDGYGPDEDEDYADDGYRPGPPPPPPCARRCGPPAGYGYGSGGVVVTTTTTVTEAPVVETRTVYETVVERVRVAPRHRVKRRCVCRVAAPPRPGERG